MYDLINEGLGDNCKFIRKKVDLIRRMSHCLLPTRRRTRSLAPISRGSSHRLPARTRILLARLLVHLAAWPSWETFWVPKLKKKSRTRRKRRTRKNLLVRENYVASFTTTFKSICPRTQARKPTSVSSALSERSSSRLWMTRDLGFL